MNHYQDLPEIIDRQLSGLKADADLLARIQSHQAQAKPSFDFRCFRLPAVAVCGLAMVFVCASLLMPSETTDFLSQPTTDENMITSQAAGISVDGSVDPSITANMPTGVISLGVGGESVTGTLFATSTSSTFPLISMSGATYRMLTTPTSISSNMLGQSLGTVSEFTLEPALGRSGVISNIVPTGTEVFAIDGMENALIASSVDGYVRVFQRVSYANTAIIGNETLSDTLCDASDAVFISLEGVGTISDADAVASVMNTLLTKADYASSSITGTQSLQIGLSNGLTLQMLVGDDTVSACGTWNAPDFFDAFQEAVSK